MKLRHLPVGLALFGAMALFSLACDSEETSSDYTDGDETADTAQASDEGAAAAGDAVTDAGEEPMDTGPIPKEAYDSLVSMWDPQIMGAEESAKTLVKLNEELKDEKLGEMLAEINTRLTGIREEFSKATPNDRQFLTVDLPRRLGEVGELQSKAMARYQEVMKAKFPQN